MAQLWSLTFKTKMKSPSDKTPYYTQIYIKDTANIDDLITPLQAMLANNAKIQASRVKLPKPQESDYELPAPSGRTNENIISLGWRGLEDQAIFSSVRIPCLQQSITPETLNNLLKQFVCAAPIEDGEQNPPLEPDFVWQSSKAVQYLRSED